MSPPDENPRPSLEPTQIGEVIGGYRLERVLGEGSMGCVFEAAHIRLGRKAAVKVLAPRLARDKDFLSRFYLEAKLVNEVRHPNIVDIFDFVETSAPRRVACVMELLDGRSLAELVKQRPLSLSQALNLILQLARALEVVHQAGIVHRDLKPANIVVVAQLDTDFSQVPCAKLLDFGIAKQEGAAASHQTATGWMLGTPSYMAPEQITGEEVGPAADIYAVGEILFESLTGQRLFKESPQSLLRAKLGAFGPRDLAPLAVLPFGGDLTTLVRRCLADRAEERPPMPEVVRAMELLLEQVGLPVDLGSLVRPSEHPSSAVTQLSEPPLRAAAPSVGGPPALAQERTIAGESTSTLAGEPAPTVAEPLPSFPRLSASLAPEAAHREAVAVPMLRAEPRAESRSKPPAPRSESRSAGLSSRSEPPATRGASSARLPLPARASRRSSWGLALLLPLLAAGGAGAWWLGVRPELKREPSAIAPAIDPLSAERARWQAELGKVEGSPAEHLERARAELATDTWRGHQLAHDELRRLLILVPNDRPALGLLVENLALWRGPRMSDAQRKLAKTALSMLAPESIEALRPGAALALVDGDRAEAKRLAEAALAADPTDGMAELLLASTYLEGDLQQALAHLDGVAQHAPQLRMRERVLARALANAGRYGSAFRTLGRRQKAAEQPAVFRLLGDLERETGRRSAAASAYRQAASHKGDPIAAQLQLLQLLLEGGELAETAELAQKVIRDPAREPEDERLAASYGARAELLRGRMKEAESLASRVLQLNARDEAATLIKAELALASGSGVEAERLAESLRSSPRAGVAALVVGARAAKHQRNVEQAVKRLEEAISREPRKATLRALLAALYLELGGFTQAAQVLEAGAQLDPAEREALSPQILFEPLPSALSEALSKARAIQNDSDRGHRALLAATEALAFGRTPELGGKERRASAQLAQARALVRAGNVNGAKLAFAAALAKNADLPLARAELAALELHGPHQEAAINTLLEVARARPELIAPRQLLRSLDR